MNYYIQGDAANADKIKAAFDEKALHSKFNFANENNLYFSCDGKVIFCSNDGGLANIIKTHPDYQELELPVEPKFKAEDRIVSKIDKSTIYRIITLHEERREYIVEIEHKDFHESCPWIAFEDQDDYELAPKPHYDIANFKPFDKVLVRDSDIDFWDVDLFARYLDEFQCFRGSWEQCIPFEGNEHLHWTTNMCDEQYINW